MATALLLLAIQLLTAVLGSPNLPQSFRDNAVSIANQAIIAAQTEINTATTTPVTQPIQPVILPPIVFGSAQQPMPQDKSAIVLTNMGKVAPADPENGIPLGSYFIKVEVLNADGNNIENAPITISIDGKEYSQITNTKTGVTGTNYYTIFDYVPQEAGIATLTVTSNNLSNSLTLSVQ